MKTFVGVIVIGFFLVGCTQMGYVQLSSPGAPAVLLSDSIQTIAIINRTFLGQETQYAVNGKKDNPDHFASDSCIKGFVENMQSWSRFDVFVPERNHYVDTVTKKGAIVTDWSLIRDICAINKADALLVLETFNSNSDSISVSNGISGDKTKKGRIPDRVSVRFTWKLYDPFKEKTINECSGSYSLIYNNGVLVPPASLVQTSYAVGQFYAYQLLPLYDKVKRQLYGTGEGKNNLLFKEAFKSAKSAHWEDAVEKWKQLSADGNSTNAGRACYNLAVASEVLGKSDMALIWAKKSYKDHANQLGLQYANDIQYRMKYE